MHRRCLAGASESSEGDPFLRADGRLQWVKWSACPWRDSDSDIGGIIITTEDITTRKEAEAEAAHLASVVTHSSDAIIAKTLDSIVTSWNAGATRLLGYRAEEMIGQLDRAHHSAGTPRRGRSDPRTASRRRSR